MKLSFKSMGQAVTSATMNGSALYVGKKGYQVVNHLVSRATNFMFAGPVQSIAVAVGAALLADQVIPKKYASLMGAIAMEQAVSSFLDSYLDPMLLKQNLIGIGSLSTASAAAIASGSGSTATNGYGRMAGYSSTRMGGYSRASMGGALFPAVNVAGLPG